MIRALNSCVSVLPCSFSTSTSSWVWRHWSQTGKHRPAGHRHDRPGQRASGLVPGPYQHSPSWCPPPGGGRVLLEDWFLGKLCKSDATGWKRNQGQGILPCVNTNSCLNTRGGLLINLMMPDFWQDGWRLLKTREATGACTLVVSVSH